MRNHHIFRADFTSLKLTPYKRQTGLTPIQRIRDSAYRSGERIRFAICVRHKVE